MLQPESFGMAPSTCPSPYLDPAAQPNAADDDDDAEVPAPAADAVADVEDAEDDGQWVDDTLDQLGGDDERHWNAQQKELEEEYTKSRAGV